MLPCKSNTIDPQFFRLAGVPGTVDTPFNLYGCLKVNSAFFIGRGLGISDLGSNLAPLTVHDWGRGHAHEPLWIIDSMYLGAD